MQTLPNDVPAGVKKWTRIGLFAVLGGLAFYFWGSIVPFVLATVKDTAKLLMYGIPTAMVLLFFWMYPEFIKMSFISLCKAVQYFFIKMDPLSYMDRYAEILLQKLKNLRKALVNLKAELISLDKQIQEDQKTMETNLRLAAAAKQEGKIAQASSFALEAKGAKDSIALYTPNRIKLQNSINFMTQMDENWDISIKGIKSFNARKRKEYQVLKKNAAVLKQSEDFLKGETPEAQIYQQSIKAAEQQMSEWLAYTEDFEARAKPILEGAAIEKRMHQNEGLDMLEEYMKDGKLMLPDFNNFNVVTQDVEYELVGNTKRGNSGFTLLQN